MAGRVKRAKKSATKKAASGAKKAGGSAASAKSGGHPGGCDLTGVDVVIIFKQNKSANPLKASCPVDGTVAFYNRSKADRTVKFDHSPFLKSMGAQSFVVPEDGCVNKTIKADMKTGFPYTVDPPLRKDGGGPPDPPEVVVGDEE